jgi:ubiquitin C-terminal hydrolase
MSLLSNYENKGLSGLANIGNTCYLNSCMQVLSHTYELNNFLATNDGEYKTKLNKIPDSIILLEWDKLRELLWTKNCVVAPYGFVKAVQRIASIKNREIFSSFAQNDVQEFLLFVIDCMHNSLARSVDMIITGNCQTDTDKLAEICYEMMRSMYHKEYSEMLNIFYGIHVSEITSINTGETLSLRPEPFSVISLSLPPPKNNTNQIQQSIISNIAMNRSRSIVEMLNNHKQNMLQQQQQTSQPITIFDCFDHYTEQEVLEGDNAWFNDKTNQKENVKRGIIYWSLPNVMIIDIKRTNIYGQKSNILIDAPLNNADFSKYVKGYAKETYVYDLYAVCNHHGGAHGGHYTASIKNANGKWYEFNDTSVNEIPENHVITNRAYCFFYRKVGNKQPSISSL